MKERAAEFLRLMQLRENICRMAQVGKQLVRDECKTNFTDVQLPNGATVQFQCPLSDGKDLGWVKIVPAGGWEGGARGGTITFAANGEAWVNLYQRGLRYNGTLAASVEEAMEVALAFVNEEEKVNG